ncbi:hypothetical protein [Noviherbaspirillum autotrophicum]|uniref:hypothetical protein n=1 Tax=Noviherbaspirillum autotrophicum TaxID=709839 RepID=UPI0012FD0B6F|nr:hypothetical protein [Noviherbaspirillum autotrophicum]
MPLTGALAPPGRCNSGAHALVSCIETGGASSLIVCMPGTNASVPCVAENVKQNGMVAAISLIRRIFLALRLWHRHSSPSPNHTHADSGSLAAFFIYVFITHAGSSPRTGAAAYGRSAICCRTLAVCFPAPA